MDSTHMYNSTNLPISLPQGLQHSVFPSITLRNRHDEIKVDNTTQKKITDLYKQFRYGESNPELPRTLCNMKGGNVDRYTIPD